MFYTPSLGIPTGSSTADLIQGSQTLALGPPGRLLLLFMALREGELMSVRLEEEEEEEDGNENMRECK